MTANFSMPPPAIGRESYLHRAAKEVLARWLREAAAEAGYDNYASLGPVSWRVNRAGPAWGVWVEYPFATNGTGHDLVWDEYDCGGDEESQFANAPPLPEWVKAQGMRLLCVADVAIQHKGFIAYALEVVHRNGCSPAKVAAYNALGVHLIEVNASWIMRRTTRPNHLLVRTHDHRGRPAWQVVRNADEMRAVQS